MASDKAVLRVIMYGFIAAAVSMIIYQNGKQKSNHGLDSGFDDQLAERPAFLEYQQQYYM